MPCQCNPEVIGKLRLYHISVNIMLRAVVPINLAQKAYLAIGLIKTKKEDL